MSLLTQNQFEALCRVRAVRPDSRGTAALRLVLVDGKSSTEAAREAGISRSAVTLTVRTSLAVIRDAKILAEAEL